VLSKKLAEGSEGLVIDVKWGNGSFIKDLEQAKQLARSMTRVGRSMKRRCVALVTDMNQPLGDTVGTSLEIKEAIQLLKGEGPEDMKELVLKLGMEIVRLAGVAGSTLSAKQTVQRHLTAFKTCFCSVTGTRLCTFVTTTSCATAGTLSTPEALVGLCRTFRRFKCVQFHLIILLR
jgi:thymidine phosphorylase